MPQEYDVVVIGAGPAGEVAAGRLAQAGKEVALVERELVGGECAYWACMPSKALLRPAELLHEAQRVPGVAERLEGRSVDATATLVRRDEVIHDLQDSGQLPWLEQHGISLIRGAARLDGPRRVVVAGEPVHAREAIVLAVGSGAAIPPIPGLHEAAAWSNREITTAKRVPERLLVLGGGVVGVEMAQAWRSLGSEVTLVEGLPRLLPREEPFASAVVREALEKSGVTIRVGRKAAAVRREGETVRMELEGGETFTGDQVLVAVGRRPHTTELGLETVGLVGGETVAVDDHLRVEGQSWLYAVGDVNGRALLTHAGKYQARIAADNILGRDARATHDGPRTPRVVFTDPQVAAVGLTLEAAQEQGVDALAIDLDTDASAGASFVGRGTGGTTRFVIDLRRELLVGATFVGFEVAEMLQAASIAVAAEVPLSALAHAIAPFPTRSELWLSLVERYEKERGTSLHAVAPGELTPAARDA